jgi:glutamate dehydrogenase/leucine dehydrogenase
MQKKELNLECKDCNKSLEDCTCIEDTIEMKQETLEEAAKRILSKEGVKLHPSGLETYLKGNVINAMVEMAKWQQERMYSEEEVLELLQDFANEDFSTVINIKEWFNKFKKK